MAELADAHGSGPCEYYFRGGSNPLIRTKKRDTEKVSFFIYLKGEKNLHESYHSAKENSCYIFFPKILQKKYTFSRAFAAEFYEFAVFSLSDPASSSAALILVYFLDPKS